ncbi:MAG: hypothetical protein NZ846_11570 [Thermus sp.]|uniref:hypothetical protein n=1 Tax=Thermus sp. TaxID=275 RepID=UPI0025D5D396|nr:hypothetical protein [Thermus sp.]MCS7219583.1 hypothetical protein [Thermus sp.]MCX7850026.1 hypothetical protein [Thermus sp.]
MRKPPPKELRLKALGVEALEEGEVSQHIRIRGPREVVERFAALPPKVRGQVVEEGMRALGLFEGKVEAGVKGEERDGPETRE